MPSTQKVTVKKIEVDKIIIQLENGQEINWPKHELPTDISEGEAWQLILTSSRNLLNEILNGQDPDTKTQA